MRQQVYITVQYCGAFTLPTKGSNFTSQYDHMTVICYHQLEPVRRSVHQKYPVSDRRKTIIGRSCHKYNFCCDKHIFVTTKHLLLQQKHACRDKMFVTTNIFLLCQIFVAANNFVATSFVRTSLLLLQQTHVCCDKRHALLQQKHACHDKTFVMTNTYKYLS